MSTSDELLAQAYVSLATLKRNGSQVRTPVWIAPELPAANTSPPTIGYIFSAGNAGKVKRLRNFSQVELATCDVRGKLLGSWYQGVADLLTEPADCERALQALRAKYGWQMWVADVGAKLSGKFNRRAYIKVTLVEATGEAVGPAKGA